MYKVQTFSPLTTRPGFACCQTSIYYNPAGNNEADDLFGSRLQATDFASYLAEERANVDYAIVFELRGKKWGTCFDTRHGY